MSWRHLATELWRAPPRIISPVEARDWADVADIHQASFSTGWTADEHAALAAQPGVTTLVSRRGNAFGSGRPVGFITFREAADEAELITLAVKPRHRRGGVGRSLVDAMLRQLYANRVASVFLEVGPENEDALSLYRRVGFRKVGERPSYYAHRAGPAKHALIMRLDMNHERR